MIYGFPKFEFVGAQTTTNPIKPIQIMFVPSSLRFEQHNGNTYIPIETKT